MFQKVVKDCTGNQKKFYFQCKTPKIFNEKLPRFSMKNSQDFQYKIPKIFNFGIVTNKYANTE